MRREPFASPRRVHRAIRPGDAFTLEHHGDPERSRKVQILQVSRHQLAVTAAPGRPDPAVFPWHPRDVRVIDPDAFCLTVPRGLERKREPWATFRRIP